MNALTIRRGQTSDYSFRINSTGIPSPGFSHLLTFKCNVLQSSFFLFSLTLKCAFAGRSVKMVRRKPRPEPSFIDLKEGPELRPHNCAGHDRQEVYFSRLFSPPSQPGSRHGPEPLPPLPSPPSAPDGCPACDQLLSELLTYPDSPHSVLQRHHPSRRRANQEQPAQSGFPLPQAGPRSPQGDAQRGAPER